MIIKDKDSIFEIEQFNGIYTNFITKEKGFSFCPHPMYICECGQPGYLHVDFKETVLCPNDFVLENKKTKEIKILRSSELFSKLK